MKNDFCLGCEVSENGFPSCSAANIASMITLESFLEDTYRKSTLHPVCHKNALTLTDHKLCFSDKCDECGLCKIRCSKNGFSRDVIHDNKVLENCSIANIAISSIYPYKIASEVKATGNFRQKRLDIVIQKESSIYFLKILSNTNKANFYKRSYLAVVDYYSQIYKNYIFKVKLLLPQDRITTVDSDYVSLFDIDNL